MPSDLIVGCGEWGFRNRPMEQHFQIAKKFGFKYLEFGIGGGQAGRLPDRPRTNEIAAFWKLCDKYQIETPFCCLENDFTLLQKPAHDTAVSIAMEQIAAAQRCGATQVRIFAGFTAVNEMLPTIWERLVDGLKRCSTLAEKLDMKISIETHGAIAIQPDGSAVHTHTVTTHRPSLERLLNEIPAYLGFNYDPANIKATDPYGEKYLLDLLNSRINYCHMKDWKRSGAGWVACAMGEDDLDYFTILRQMQYTGVYLIEYEPVDDVEEGIQRSLNYLRRVEPNFRLG